MERADQQLAGISDKEARRQRYFDIIPDGEPLVLQITLARTEKTPRSLDLETPVTGIKQGTDAMISLTDFTASASFPIRVEGSKGTAEGWFIRKEQPFFLDINQHTVKIIDQTLSVSDDEVLVQDDDILIKSQTLAKWFGASIATDLQSQRLTVKTAQLWPEQENLLRAVKKKSLRAQEPAKQPYYEDDPDKISLTRANVNITHSYHDGPNKEATQRTAHSAIVNGEVMGYATTAQLLGSDQETLRSARVRFTKSSDKNDLLGPLHATRYDFNDISGVSVPLTGGSHAGRGINVTNRRQGYTSDTSTQIEGFATPGWDVEIYRDNQYLGGMTIGDDGRYVFDNITLFIGENKFKIVKYSITGEVEEEERVLNVSNIVDNDIGTYNVSLMQQGEQTYTAQQSKSQDLGTLQFAGTYERPLTDLITGKTGLDVLQEAGDYHGYLHNGIVTKWGEKLLNVDSLFTSLGTYMVSSSLRGNIGEHHFAGTIQHRGEDFTSSGPPQDRPAVYGINTSLSGPLDVKFNGQDVSYGLTATTTYFADGKLTQTTSGGLATTIDKIRVNSDLSYSGVRAGDVSEDHVDGRTALGGYYLGASWRTSLTYAVYPELILDSFSANVQKRLSRNLTAASQIRYGFEDQYTIGEVALNWNQGKVILSPALSYDSDSNVNARISARFGLTRDPYTNDILMSSSAGSANSGGVSAFVFLDKNGDNEFSSDDEPLEDVVVEATQLHITAATNKDGEAMLRNMSPNRITDVVVQENTTFDPNWVASDVGVSMRARPGHVTRLAFPIHRGGSVEGMAAIKISADKTRPFRNAHLYLYNGDGKLVRSTLTDAEGYYVIERVPPGHYWLIVDQDDAKDNQAVRPLPPQFDFTYEGTVLTGQNLIFDAGKLDVATSITPDMSDFLAANPGADVKPLEKENSIVLNLGNQNSNLLMSVLWYKLKIFYNDLVGDGELLVEPIASNNSAKTGTNTLRVRLAPGTSAEEAYRRCRILVENDFSCGVEILPKGMKTAMTSSSTAKN